MYKRNRLMKAIAIGVTGCLARFGFAAEAAPAAQVLYPAETRQSFAGPPDWFTGDVRVEMLFPDNENARFSGAYVTFQAGARTAWHLHPAGQHMVVTSGTALTGTRDGKVIEFGEGETVWCPPDLDHWHGATPDAPMTHLVITGSRDGENVVWKEKVTDEVYYGDRQVKDKTTANVDALTARQQGIVPIAAFTASGDLDSLKGALEAGLNAGLTVNEVKEIQIQLYAYAGFPRALNGLATFMTLLDERKARGIDDETGPEATALPADRSSLALGREVQTELAGRPVSGPLFDFAPAINEFLQSHLFGDLFGRGILDYQDRELATLSALASIDGVNSQLKAHIGIATNVGLTETQLSALAAVLNERVNRQAGERVAQALQPISAG